MAVEKTPTIRDYLAGAVLANSLVWLTLGITPFFETDPLTLVRFYFIAYASGAIMAGYLVARKTAQNHVKTGLKAGLGSFVFHIYVFMGVIELVTGRRVLSMLDHLLIFVILVSGGVLGAFLCKQRLRKKQNNL